MMRRFALAALFSVLALPSWSALRITGAKDMRGTIGYAVHGTAGDSRWVTFSGAASTPIKVYLCDSPLRDACHDGSATRVLQTITDSSVSAATFTVVTAGLSSGADGALHYLFVEDGGNNKSQLWKFMVDGTVPSVTGYSGTINHGENVRVFVSNAGTRGDYHAHTDKVSLVFDQFNDATLLSNSYLTWSIFNEAQTPITFQTGSPRTAISGDGYWRRHGPVGIGNLVATPSSQTEYLYTAWRRLSPSFSIDGAPEQWKSDTRLESSNANSSGNKTNVYMNLLANNVWGSNFEFVEQQGGLPQVTAFDFTPSFSLVKDQFRRIDIYFRKESSLNARDGLALAWENGQLVADFLDEVKDRLASGVLKHKGDFFNGGGNFAGAWRIGNYFNSAESTDWVDYDDILLDYSLARIEVCGGSTWATRWPCEIQETKAWASSYVDIKVNRGALAAGSTNYLYAVDGNGNTNLSGFQVAFGSAATGGDVTAPTITTHTPVNVTHNGFQAGATFSEPSTVEFNYGPTTAYGSTMTVSAFVDSATFTVSGLTPSSITNYRFKVADAAGNVRTGGNNTVTTLSTPDTTAPTATDIGVVILNPMSVEIQFRPSEATYRSVAYSADESYSLQTTTGTTAGGVLQTITISGLTPGQLYNWRLNLMDGSNNQTTYTGFTWQTVAPEVRPGAVILEGAATLQ